MVGITEKSSSIVPDMSWVLQKVQEMKSHPAWQEHVDETESERLLKNHSVFTFLLRPGKDMYHYFLSYVEMDHTIQHKLVRIELSMKGWLYRNGGGNIREKIDELIPVALHYDMNQCKPFKNLERPTYLVDPRKAMKF